MPNHILNVLTFKDLKPEEKNFILNNFTTKIANDIYPLNLGFDFDKIVPEPRVESDCPDDCKVNKDSHVETTKDRPWFDWYTWRNKYWGTKWNAYDNSYVIINTDNIKFVFCSAWTPPWYVYQSLAAAHYFQFEVEYADEDLGSNCGIIKSEHEDGFGSITAYEVDTPSKFAQDLWVKYGK